MTDALKQAAQQALEAMLESVDVVQNEYDNDWRHGKPTRQVQLDAIKLALDNYKAAIEALRTALSAPQPAEPQAIDYTPGGWFMAHTVDEMQRFFRSRLPAIREAANACGYAIGVHGSERRDFDLIAMQWRDGADSADELAHEIAKAACGIARGPDVDYEWKKKPAGRIATSIPICWAAKWADDMAGAGHIDLSVIPSAPPQSDPYAPPEIQEAIERGEFEPGHWTISAQRAIENNPSGALRIIAKLRDDVAGLKASPAPAQAVPLTELLDKRESDSYSCGLLVRDIRAALGITAPQGEQQ